MQLLGDYSVLRIDGADNGRREEGKTLNCDVVEQEDERRGEDYRIEYAAERLRLVELVYNCSLADALRLDTSDGQVLLRRGKPPGSFRSICEREERYKRQTTGDDALNGEDHPPTRK